MKKTSFKLLLVSVSLLLSACADITHWTESKPYVFDPSDPDYYMVPNTEIIVVAPDQDVIAVEQVGQTTVISSPY